MTNERKEYLLRGLDEYYKNRKDILMEDAGNEVVEINGILATKIPCTFEEYAKKNNLINAHDIIWTSR